METGRCNRVTGRGPLEVVRRITCPQCAHSFGACVLHVCWPAAPTVYNGGGAAVPLSWSWEIFTCTNMHHKRIERDGYQQTEATLCTPPVPPLLVRPNDWSSTHQLLWQRGKWRTVSLRIIVVSDNAFNGRSTVGNFLQQISTPPPSIRNTTGPVKSFKLIDTHTCTQIYTHATSQMCSRILLF